MSLFGVHSVTSFIGALTGTAVVDRVGRRKVGIAAHIHDLWILTITAKLMLFACICCTIGMSIVAGLLSPSGPQTTPRAEAGVTFIYLFMGTSV